ncbi:PE-PPE domain-containing protein [Mycolicibacterium vaccae]|uniref:PE-PPE domain-containing protein n=1 Tax=Mycolicibacterium vaccae TaxID=1810 RepID=UPI003CE67A0C
MNCGDQHRIKSWRNLVNTKLRNAGLACATTFAAAAVALSTATGAGAASSAVVIAGLNAQSLGDGLLRPLLGGAFEDQERTSVEWPAEARPYTGFFDKTLGESIEEGKANLRTAIRTALAGLDRDANGNVVEGQKVTVMGISAGALVVNEVMRDLARESTAPLKNLITFVVAGDASRQNDFSNKYADRLDYTYRPAAVTPYDTVVVTAEYDGLADFPDRPGNFWALANALAGAILLHVPSAYADLSEVPEDDITSDTNARGGITTRYFLRAERLPIVRLLPFLASREKELKAKIDKAYSRNDTKTADPTPAVATAAASPTEPAATEDAPVRRHSATAAAATAPVASSADVATAAESDGIPETVEEAAPAPETARVAPTRAETRQAKDQARQATEEEVADVEESTFTDQVEETEAASTEAQEETAETASTVADTTGSAESVGSSDSPDSSE